MRLVYDNADIPRAFAAYDKLRRPRSQRLVKHSRNTGLLYDLQLPGVMDDWDKVKDILSANQKWIWEEDLEGDIKESERVYNDETSRL